MTFMSICKDASREISFDFWAERQRTEDRSLPKMNSSRTFIPFNQATGKKADIHNNLNSNGRSLTTENIIYKFFYTLLSKTPRSLSPKVF
jgi:hypothetical protein